ncbi:MAG: PEP-CTERM sorting domain-containing protein [Bryobacteraceae bacterium]
MQRLLLPAIALVLPMAVQASTLFGTQVQVGALDQVGTAAATYVDGILQPGSIAQNGGIFAGSGSAFSTAASAGLGFTTISTGSASLADASIRAAVGAPSIGLGTSSPQMHDTLTFTNLTGGYLFLNLSEVINGTLSGATPPAALLTNRTFLAIGNSGINSLLHLENGVFTTGPVNGIGYNLATQNSTLTAGFYGDNSQTWTTSLTGLTNATMSTQLGFAPGETTLSIVIDTVLDCRFGAVCDYGHTSTFQFGSLPTGLSFTSASGQFLTAGDTATPEPSSIALFGLGMVALALLYRR